MNVTTAFTLIRAIPYNVTANRQSGEWRVRVHSNPDTDYFTDDNDDAVYTAIDMALRAQRFTKLPRDTGSPAGHYVRRRHYGPEGRGDILPAMVMVGPFATAHEAQAHAEKCSAMGKAAVYGGEYDAGELAKIAANPEGFYQSSVWIKAAPEGTL